MSLCEGRAANANSGVAIMSLVTVLEPKHAVVTMNLPAHCADSRMTSGLISRFEDQIAIRSPDQFHDL
jgi:hypothetical protein